MSEKWLNRTSQCWKTASYGELSHLCNQSERQKQPLATRTREQLNRQNQQPKQAKIQRLALLHFHPKIVEKYAHQIPKTLSVDEVKALGLYSTSEDCVYSQSDTVVNHNGKRVVLLVPNYLINDAIYDVNQAKKVGKLTSEIKNITSIRTNATTSRNASIFDSPPPVTQPVVVVSSRQEKRTRAAPTIEELEEENQRLRSQNEKLRKQLEVTNENLSASLCRNSFLEEFVRYQQVKIDQEKDKVLKRKVEVK